MSSSKPTRAKAGAKRRPVAVKKTPTRAAAKKPTSAKAAKPAASATLAPTGVAGQMAATAAAMESALSACNLDSLPNDSLQKLMAVVVKVYAAKREAGDSFLPLSAAGRVTPTDIMVTSSQLLRSGNLQVFELGMWQSWTGN